MVILDRALQKREDAGKPIRVGLIGAGFMGRAIARQICTPLVGMRLAAIANRHVDGAQRAWSEAGESNAVTVKTQRELDAAIAAGRPVAVDDSALLCHSAQIDVLIEVTGHVESSAHTVLEAIAGRKHIVLMNAELDATVGPILKKRADDAGVIISNTEGDEPGVVLNLYRYVKTIGYQPMLAGNIKGFLDRYRTPETQRGFAEKTGQSASMVTSFADGTKLSMEACLVANATGLKVGQRGMFGPKCAHVKDVLHHFTPEQLLEQPLVDFALGAEPGTGAFVVGYNDEPAKQPYMSYFKMGDGPLYVFYTPYHLPHLEVPLTAARAVLFGDAAVAPIGAPVGDVVTVAKRDLKIGETLDGVGGFTCYGMIENAETAREENLLPMGLSEGCRLVRDVSKDTAISNDDVERPDGRLCDRLRTEQDTYFHAACGLA
jgi:predicted homoserine dehydrogenase-like protein